MKAQYRNDIDTAMLSAHGNYYDGFQEGHVVQEGYAKRYPIINTIIISNETLNSGDSELGHRERERKEPVRFTINALRHVYNADEHIVN